MIEVKPVNSVDRVVALIQPFDLSRRGIQQTDAARIIRHENLLAVGMHGGRLRGDKCAVIDSLQPVLHYAVDSTAISIADNRNTLPGQDHVARRGIPEQRRRAEVLKPQKCYVGRSPW